jgi:hypothetical protein
VGFAPGAQANGAEPANRDTTVQLLLNKSAEPVESSQTRVKSQERSPFYRGLDSGSEIARITYVQVVLRKLGRGSRAVTGRLVRAPRKGSVVVIEFSDGMHEYVTTPVKRVLRLAARDVFYIETVNSRYRLEVRDRERALEDASSG